MKIKELNLDAMVQEVLYEEAKSQIIDVIKNYQYAIAKAERAVAKLKERYTEFLDQDIEDFISDPDSKRKLLV